MVLIVICICAVVLVILGIVIANFLYAIDSYIDEIRAMLKTMANQQKTEQLR